MEPFGMETFGREIFGMETFGRDKLVGKSNPPDRQSLPQKAAAAPTIAPAPSPAEPPGPGLVYPLPAPPDDDDDGMFTAFSDLGMYEGMQPALEVDGGGGGQ